MNIYQLTNKIYVEAKQLWHVHFPGSPSWLDIPNILLPQSWTELIYLAVSIIFLYHKQQETRKF